MPDLRSMTIRRIKTGSVFRLLAASLFCTLIPLCVVMGIFGYFGFNTLSWNNQPLHGVTAIVASPFIGAFMAAIFTGVFGVLVAFGLWIFSNFRTLKIEFLVEEGSGAA